MIRNVRNSFRLLRIGWLLVRHDAVFVLEPVPGFALLAKLVRLPMRKSTERPGKRLARALVAAGPSFVKLGQALSTRADLFGDALTADLSDLQDRLPPFPTEQARATIESELGKSIDTFFLSIEEHPVAAASIAQVHFAVTTEGREVAVKVLRPDVEKAFARDLDLFYWIAEKLETYVPEVRRLRPVDSVRLLAGSVAMEMDLRFEAAAASEITENFKGDPRFRVPAVDWTRTAQRVMTTERITGIPIDERAALIEIGHQPLEVLAEAARAFFLQVFRDGLFHADMHAGNLFVLPDGAIAAVDFGIVGRLEVSTRRHLAELLLSFLERDFRRAAEVHFEAGWIPADQSIDAFAQACRSIAEPILDRPQNEISVGQLLAHLFRVTENFGMEAQPQLLLLQKTMLIAEGTGRRICPDANMWLLARPMIEEWMLENFSAPARVRSAMKETLDAFTRAPEILRRAEQVLMTLSAGQVRLHPEVMASLNGGRGQSLFLQILPWIGMLALAAALIWG